jgi:hypothetical protein
MKYCENCGCKSFRGLCTNCHEENYIEDQYVELGIPTPKSIYEKARENEAALTRVLAEGDKNDC